MLTKVARNKTFFTPKPKFLPKYQRTPTSFGAQKSLFHSISIYAAKNFTQVNPRANSYRINKYRFNTSPISVSDFEVNEFDQDENTVVGAKLIPIVNKLQEVFSLVGMHLDLPQIVVVGAQSSGKSSVLENLVGKDFLPRGSGIVTRRPLILQMHKTDPGTVEYGEFFHKPNEKFLDFHKIREEIERETDRLTGKNKGVSADPIILRVYSPNILPLTLVDTPGIARVPVGDQPHDIEKQIRDMVHSYILPRNAIILAVQAANQDLATSDALKISREVDPEGNRTIGVLTKLDLMDAGTNALDALSGRVIPLKLGFVGVVNRSQLDINMGKSITTSLKNEREYFEKNNHYNLIANRCGTRYLALKCNKLLTRHIREVLPEIKRDIKKKLRTLKDELMELGEPPVGSINDKKWMLLQMLNKFCVDFRDAIEGNKTLLTTQELHGGARIRYIFDDIFRKQLNSIDPTAGLTLDEYRMAIRNAAGAKQSLFVPEGAFEMLVKRQIEKLKDPALQCAELVLNELQRICAKLDYKDLGRFTYLRESVNDVANNVLRKNLAPTQRMIKDLIECELAYINTNHPDFVGGTQMSMLNQLPEGSSTQNVKKEPYKEEQRGLFNLFFGGKKKEDNLNQEQQSNIVNAVKLELPSNLTINSELTEREKIQVGLIKRLLESYFNIARKNIQDAVTKAIWHFLVNKAEQTLHRALITELYQDGDHERLLKESDVVKERRRILQSEIDALKKAKQILEVSEVPELLD